MSGVGLWSGFTPPPHLTTPVICKPEAAFRGSGQPLILIPGIPRPQRERLGTSPEHQEILYESLPMRQALRRPGAGQLRRPPAPGCDLSGDMPPGPASPPSQTLPDEIRSRDEQESKGQPTIRRPRPASPDAAHSPSPIHDPSLPCPVCCLWPPSSDMTGSDPGGDDLIRCALAVFSRSRRRLLRRAPTPPVHNAVPTDWISRLGSQTIAPLRSRSLPSRSLPSPHAPSHSRLHFTLHSFIGCPVDHHAALRP